MQIKYESAASHESKFVLQKPFVRFLIIGFLFITAFVVRLHNINTPPMEFQPIRQYMMAHNTRVLYYEGLESMPEEKKELARINKERMGFDIEAPVLDHIVAFGYRIIGGEHLWMPRVLSSIFWLIGGVFLYLIAVHFFSSGAALFSTVFYLFFPYGISASRSFQPDPLMIMLLLCSIFVVLKYYDKPSLSRLIMATAASSLPMIIKPYSIFMIFGSFISLAIYSHGIRKLFTNRDFLIFILLSPVPGGAYYLSGLLTQGSFLQEHAQATFHPHFLLQLYFWKNWLAMILRVVGLIAFAGALLGLFIVRNRSRNFLIGLWIGYVIYGLLFTFHIHTHDYYQLPFVPVVALSLGPPGALVLRRVFASNNGKLIMIIVLLAILFGAGINNRKAQSTGYTGQSKIFGYIVGINPQFYKFINEDFEKEVKTAKEIGKIVEHSTNTLFLTPDYGRSLTYHGELSGLPWPLVEGSLRERKKRGIRIPQKEELFNAHYFTIRTHGKFIQYTPDFFIVTDFKEFERQPDLKEFLTMNFPIVVNNDDYMIFNTSKMKKD